MYENGKLFSAEDMKKVRDSFYYVDVDSTGKKRLYFDNAGGSYRLKMAEDRFHEIDMFPDCPERRHQMALFLNDIDNAGKNDVRMIFNVKGGSIVTNLTASQVMFDIVGAVVQSIPGSNIVTSVLEHPSAFDAAGYYAKKMGKELRVAKSNPETGGVDPDEVARLIDENTCLLSVMYASNISGAIFDIPEIVKKARAIKPNLYIIVDAVQHAPHAAMDFSDLGIDGVNFAPYKFFGVRGFGVGWVSDRLATLKHHAVFGPNPADWDLGSPAPAMYAMLIEVVNYVCSLSDVQGTRRECFVSGMTKIALHERALLKALLDGTVKNPGLRQMKNVHVFMDCNDLTTRDLIIGIGFDNLGYTEAVKEYEKRGIIVYERVTSSLYSRRMLESFGLDGTIRVSPLHCNTVEDIDKFLEISAEIAKL